MYEAIMKDYRLHLFKLGTLFSTTIFNYTHHFKHNFKCVFELSTTFTRKYSVVYLFKLHYYTTQYIFELLFTVQK